jgi:hypothetical protein
MEAISQMSLQALHASTQTGSATPQAADPASISRFEQLLDQPGKPLLDAGGQGGVSEVIRNESESMSSMWSSAQTSMENLLKKNGDLSMKDVLHLQYEMVKTSATFEVVSKAAGMTEKGAESLFQRN